MLNKISKLINFLEDLKLLHIYITIDYRSCFVMLNYIFSNSINKYVIMLNLQHKRCFSEI